MLGAFKPSAPLSGGLLWKIPYRLSRPQKLRHRRRLRRVDNVVAVLDDALKRQAAFSSTDTSSSTQKPALAPNTLPNSNKTTPATLSTTIEGEVLLAREIDPEQSARRHGKGPKQGDMVPVFSEHGVKMPSGELLSTLAKTHGTMKVLERWKAEMPTEQQMLPRDKYTVFNRYAKNYRKGVHKIPKWTRVSQRVNPPGF